MLSKAERSEAIKLLMDLVSIPSKSGSEQKISEFIFNWMSRKGFHHVKRDSAGNVYGSTSSSPVPRLLYCGHMDTVPGEVPVKMENNRLYGRGSSDAKGPLAAMLFSAYITMVEKGDDVSVLAVTGEESGSTGIKHALKNGIVEKFAVFGEPSGSNRIVTGYRGRLEAKVEFRSQSFHASKPWVGRSALQCAVDFAKKVETLWGHPSDKEKFNTVSATVTELISGVAPNVSPPLATVTVDVRIPPGRPLNAIINDLQLIVKESAEGAQCEMKLVEASDAVLIDPLNPIVKAMRRAIYRATGTPGICVRKTGSGDMNHAVMHNIHCVTYGPGNTLDEHSESESIEISDYIRSIEVLKILPSELYRMIA
jgi:LysW-gamma-L-lysine carboxypeptidase